MAFKMKYKNLEEVVKQLKGAVKAHGKQAEMVQDHIDEMNEGSPLQKYVSDAQREAVHASKAERGMPKALIGNQNKLPEELKDKIEKAPETPLAKKSGTNVSWKYGGKTYHGTLIPSKETATHRYARTHNGKIKSLPKNK